MNDLDQQPAAGPLEPLRHQVHAGIGQLLLTYQHLELMLKALLPHLHASGQAMPEDAQRTIDNLLDSKQTMGLLVAKLRRSLDIADPEGFETYLAQITANRNELVHKFTLLDFGGLDSEAKCQAAIEYLNARHEFALPLRGVLLAFLGTLMQPVDIDTHGKQGETP